MIELKSAPKTDRTVDIPIIASGEIVTLTKHKEQDRTFMRTAKTFKERADWKRKFKATRNRIEALRGH